MTGEDLTKKTSKELASTSAQPGSMEVLLITLEPDSDLYVAHVGFGSVSRLSMTPIIASFAKPSAVKANAS
jgi:hypothetical protein